jgi:hypothetical protein
MPAGNRGRDQQQHASLGDRLHAARAHQAPRRLHELHPIGSKVPGDRHERAHMQRDVEGQPGVRPSEQPRGERQMRRAADGQELGESLHQTKHDRFKDAHAGTGAGRGAADATVRSYSASYCATTSRSANRARASAAAAALTACHRPGSESTQSPRSPWPRRRRAERATRFHHAARLRAGRRHPTRSRARHRPALRAR